MNDFNDFHIKAQPCMAWNSCESILINDNKVIGKRYRNLQKKYTMIRQMTSLTAF